MAKEKIKWVNEITESLSWVLWDISKALTELKNNIIETINKLLKDLWFKQEIEIQKTINESKTDLNALEMNVEKEILNWILDKNKELKSYLYRIEKKFWGNIKELELEYFLIYLKEKIVWWKIEQSEIDNLTKEVKENKEKIEEDDELRNIIKEIVKDKESLKEEYNIKEINIRKIVEAYENCKKNNDNNWKTINKELVLEELKNLEKNTQ